MATVVVFMIACYGGFGVMAVVALALNMGLLLAVLSVLAATLTLPGIAGIVLTMGMAVDANVLIFERIREELRQGRSAGRAIETGFGKALSAIMDSNITGLLTALIMFAIGSGPVRGFAVTLGLGILTSMFTAVYVTRLIIETWMRWKRPKAITLKDWIRLAPEETAIDFFRFQWLTFGTSVTTVVASLLMVATLGLNFGIDFIGAAGRQQTGRWLNNRAENSHLPFRRRERAMSRFRRMRSLQKFAAVHSSVFNHFNHERSLYSRQNFKRNRAAALAEWRNLGAA